MNRILIVDDDENIRRFYGELLTSEGFETREAGDPEKALRILQSMSMDLVLLDIRMPIMDGIEMRQVIDEAAPHVKVLVSSVYSLDEQRRKIPNADAYFDKSHGTGALLVQIRKLLRGIPQGVSEAKGTSYLRS